MSAQYEGGISWKEAWSTFCQNTSLHGLKQIAEPQPFTIRRLLWLLLVLVGVALSTYQICQSVLTFCAYPVTVNVLIRYNDTVEFPALTICNQNAFRSTLASDSGHYDLLKSLFVDSSTPQVDLDTSGASNITLLDIYSKYSHSKEDMIVHCTWDGSPCDPEDFSTTLTDIGLCYTFNQGQNGRTKHASRTGANGGLQLLLNIEQYEYMPGPNHGAGVRILAHPQDEVPLMRDLGMALLPGSHSIVGLKTVHVTNMLPPHGNCNDSIELTHHRSYTKTNCLAECGQEHLEAACRCLQIYMTSGTHGVPVCTLQEYMDCAKHSVDTYKANSNHCVCPEACQKYYYDSSLSLGYISNFDSMELLQSNLTPPLQESFARAQEVTQRVQPDIVRRERSAILALNNTASKLEGVFQLIQSALVEMTEDLKRNLSQFRERIHFHWDKGLESVKYIMEHDFARGFTVVEERTLRYVTSNFYELLMTFDRTLKEINETDSGELRHVIWLGVDTRLQNSQTMAQTAIDNLTMVNFAYKYGRPLLTFKLTLDRRYDMTFIDRTLLQKKGKYQREYYNNLMVYLDNYLGAISSLRAVGLTLVESGLLNHTFLGEIKADFIAACKGYNYELFRLKDRIIRNPVELIDGTIEEFRRLNRTLFETEETLSQTVLHIQSLLASTNSTSLEVIRRCLDGALLYLVDPSITKKELAMLFTSSSTGEAVRHLDLSFGDLKSRARDLSKNILQLSYAMQAVWRSMLAEETVKVFYQTLNEDFQEYLDHPNQPGDYLRIFADLLDADANSFNQVVDGTLQDQLTYRLNADIITIDVSEKMQTIVEYGNQLDSLSDITSMLQGHDKELLDEFHQYKMQLEKYIKDSVVDVTFYKDNFIRFDIFMQSMSYEEIHQQEAYGLVNMLGDIGGSVGLFLGASALSVFEIFDMAFFFFHWRNHDRKTNRMQGYSTTK